MSAFKYAPELVIWEQLLPQRCIVVPTSQNLTVKERVTKV